MLPHEDIILKEIKSVLKHNYWRDIYTKSGKKMSIKISNCGNYGWYSDDKGYRYTPVDPLTNLNWQPIPPTLFMLAQEAAKISGYLNFIPDCCLMNRYEVGNQLSLHQDLDEKDFSQPIVSFSFGLPATFLLGGLNRNIPPNRYILNNCDALVFGYKDRLLFHGVEKIQPSNINTKIGNIRINLTFRKAV